MTTQNSPIGDITRALYTLGENLDGLPVYPWVRGFRSGCFVRAVKDRRNATQDKEPRWPFRQRRSWSVVDVVSKRQRGSGCGRRAAQHVRLRCAVGLLWSKQAGSLGCPAGHLNAKPGSLGRAGVTTAILC